MSERVTMPALGESVTEGTVTRWLKSVGDEVAVDEPLLEVSTDKVDTEIPSPVAGTLQEILVEEDETVDVGADLCVIGDGDAPADSGTAAEPAEEKTEETAEETAEQTTEEAPQQAQVDEAAEEAAEQTPESSSQGSDDTSAQQSSGGGVGTNVPMPALGESVTEGTVTRWLKAEGDEVAVDEPLLEVSTDKVDTEIPSPVAGTLTKILVQEDETVDVGADLCVIGGSAPQQEAPKQEAPKQEVEETEAAMDEAPAAKQEEAPKQSAPAPAPSVATTGSADASAYVTPLVRKLAAENNIDLATVKGTGIGGRIRKQDVLAAAEAAKAPQPAPAAGAAQDSPAAAQASQVTEQASPHAHKRGTREKMTRLRKVIAQRMVESLQVSAQLTTVVEVDMTKVARLRDSVKDDFAAREGTKLPFLPFIAQATAEALKAHPNVNASVEGDEIVYAAAENLSIAVDTERGLLTPVVKNAGDLNVAGLARAIADVAERTRNNRITPDDLSDGTFTITNTGSRGALFDTPILNQPQVAMLGTGAVVRRPIVVEDAEGSETIAIRSMMYMVLTYDHRVVDGADAARFLTTVKDRLEAGQFKV